MFVISLTDLFFDRSHDAFFSKQALISANQDKNTEDCFFVSFYISNGFWESHMITKAF